MQLSRQFTHRLLLFLLCADAQNPFIELIHGPCCLATWVELLCLLLNHYKVLSFILYQKIERGKGKKDYGKQNEKENAQTVSLNCKLNHMLWVDLGRGTFYKNIFCFTWGIDWQMKVLSHILPEQLERKAVIQLISSGISICKVMRAVKKPHWFFFLDSCDEWCFLFFYFFGRITSY